MARRAPHQYSNGENFQPYKNGFSDPVAEQNDYLIDGLRNKVSSLKSLTLDMGDEIKDQNLLLKDMDNTFDSTWGRLSSSMKRVQKLAMSGHNRYIFYLFMFSLFVFFIIYIMMKFR